MGQLSMSSAAREAMLERMMRENGAQLVGLCTALLGNAHDAQDAVQETFIRAYRAMDRFRGEREGSERAWLTRIAVNLCRSRLRSARFRFGRRCVPLEYAQDIAADASGEERELYDVVLALDGRSREVILMHYYQEMSVHEIAQVFGRPPSTVYRWIERARMLIREEWERREGEWTRTGFARP